MNILFLYSRHPAVIRAIDTEKYEPVLIGITKKGQWFHFRGEVEQIENDTWQQGDITTAFCCLIRLSMDLWKLRISPSLPIE